MNRSSKNGLFNRQIAKPDTQMAGALGDSRIAILLSSPGNSATKPIALDDQIRGGPRATTAMASEKAR